MQVPKIVDSENKNNIQKRRIIKNTAILAATTTLSPSVFLLADNFTSNKKNYLKEVQKEKDIFEKNIWQDARTYINKLFTLTYKPISESEMEAVIQKSKFKFKSQFDARSTQEFIQTKKAQTNYKTHLNINLYVNNSKKISFKGIIDKFADELSSEELKNLQNYVNGLCPTIDEVKLARSIADFRVKEWPKGILDSYVARYQKPSSDREYHLQLLKQEIIVPPEPPKYYRGYDKLFNTQRWQDFQKWPEYFKKAIIFERMESIIKNERIKSYAAEKELIQKATKKELSYACLKYQINEEVLSNFKSDSKKAKIPDAIMIQSKNQKDATEILKWIVGKSNSNYVYVEDKNEANYERLDQILTALEEAKENYKKNGKRTLVWVENFDKLLSEDSNNEDVIGDLKDLLDKISKHYKTTVIFSCNGTQNLNPIALQPHRVKIYNIDKEAPLEELKIIQNNYILTNIQKIKNSDGYRFKYIPFEQNFVDLYLGDFSHNSNILWVNSQNTDAIEAVIKNFDIIKKITKFKNIKSLKFPKPDNIKYLDHNKLKYTGNITMDGKAIYEYNV